jgi:hypothetical protein
MKVTYIPPKKPGEERPAEKYVYNNGHKFHKGSNVCIKCGGTERPAQRGMDRLTAYPCKGVE